MRSFCRATFLVALISSEGIAQNGFDWFIGGGPSRVTQRGYSFLKDNVIYEVSSTDTLLLGGEAGRAIATVGVARRVASSALNFRVEATYQSARSESGVATWRFGNIIRAALREEKIGGHAGLEWNAIPSGAWSPYIVTSAGIVRTTLRWNTDSSSVEPNRSTHSKALHTTIGFGIRARIMGRSLFAESRRQWWTNDWSGSRSHPIVIGMRMR